MVHNRNKRGVRRGNGSVLPVLVTISVIVGVLGVSMLSIAYHARMRTIRVVQGMAARVAADDGLTVAIRELKAECGNSKVSLVSLPSATDVDIPNFEGTFSYATIEGPSDGYTITSVGKYQQTQRTVEAVMQWGGVIHEYALFALQGLVLNNSAQVDSYNEQSDDSSLKIGTNSTEEGAISLHTDSCVDGDVTVGLGGDPTSVIQMNGGQYTGSASAATEEYETPAVSVPAYLTSASSSGKIDDSRTIATSGRYTSISLGNGETLVIDGNVELYIAGKVTLGNSAEIQINEGCSLILYVDGTIEGQEGSLFNNLTEDPACFKLFGTESCSKITLKNSGDMYAVIYAPSADLTLFNSAAVWGSITSYTCDLKAGASVHYDASLADSEDPSLPPVLKLTRWREY